MNPFFSTRAALAVLASGLLLLSCQKPTDGPTLVEGQVIEHTGRQPVGGATVQVWQAGKAGGYAPVGQEQPTDGQGRFRFRFEAERESGYIVMATAPPGYVTDWGLAPSLTAGRRNKDLVVPMYAPAWVKLVLVDEPPKSRVILYLNGYEGNGEEVRYPRDTTFVRPCIAGLTKGIYWSITNDRGTSTIHSHDAQPAPLDTVTVRIAF